MDEALVKTDRIIEMEKLIKKDGNKATNLNSKIMDSLHDIVNYLIFALIHIKEGADEMQ